jgi:uncharacterized protein
VFAVRIELDSLVGSKGAFQHTYAQGELDFNDERVRLSSSPQVSGTLIRKGNRVLVQGRLAANVEVDCDRCLRSLELAVAAQFNLQYMTQAEYEASQTVELEDVDLTVSVFDGEAIDVDELVCEQILLAVPQRTLCRLDCKGLCANCGSDRNLRECDCQTAETDPRWTALKNLRV